MYENASIMCMKGRSPLLSKDPAPHSVAELSKKLHIVYQE